MTKYALHLIAVFLEATFAVTLTVLAVDAPEVSFRKAADLAARHQYDDDAYLVAVQGALPLYPVVAISTQEGHAVQSNLILNRQGMGFDAFRFRAPPDQPRMLLWSFAFPHGPAYHWYIVPATGRMTGFASALDLPSFQYDQCPWPPESLVTVQVLNTGFLDPGREYIIWFAMEVCEPVEVPMRLLALADINNQETGIIGRIVTVAHTNGLSVCLERSESLCHALGVVTSPMWQRAQLRCLLGPYTDRKVLDRLMASGAIKPDQFEAAWVAADAANVDALRYLLSRGADPNMTPADSGDTTPLHRLATYQSGIMKPADELDADDAKMADGVTCLIKAGADPNRLEATDGMTPLMLAAYRLRPATCQRLLDLGSDVSLRNRSGATALDIVRRLRADEWMRKQRGGEARWARMIGVLDEAMRKLPPESERYASPDPLRPLAYDGTTASLLRIRAAVEPAAQRDANVVAIALARQVCYCLGDTHLLEALSFERARLRAGDTVRQWTSLVHQKAESGDPFFACTYVCMLADSRGGADDPAYADAIAVCKRFSKAGYFEATRKVAIYRSLQDGRFDEADFKLAGEQGSAEALHELGLHYYWGCDVHRDYAKACTYLAAAAERGHAQSMIDLGRCYLRGQGVATNAAVARQWFQRAQAAGHPDAVKWLTYYFPQVQAPQAKKEASPFDEVDKP